MIDSSVLLRVNIIGHYEHKHEWQFEGNCECHILIVVNRFQLNS